MSKQSGKTKERTEEKAHEAGEKPKLAMRVKHRLGWMDEPVIVTYPSRGNHDWLRVKGRVMEREALAKPDPDSGVLSNVLNTVRRLESDELAGASVRATFRDVSVEDVTDSEGYFSLRLDLEERVDGGWHEVRVEAVEPLAGAELEATAKVLVPRSDAEFAVVSDLDDTVIHTRATDTWGQVRMVFGHNSRTRPPFPGVSAFYRALQAGPDGRGANPFFYVSLSGWNLYDLFEDFIEAHELPLGPFFMTDLRILEGRSEALGHAAPKLERCSILLENYPQLPFVLIGDSGQHDPENYREVADRHPGRIKAIYIRDVTPDERDREVQALADELAERGVPMFFSEDTAAAAEHAAELGLIAPEAVDEVREEVERERAEDAEG